MVEFEIELLDFEKVAILMTLILISLLNGRSFNMLTSQELQ